MKSSKQSYSHKGISQTTNRNLGHTDKEKQIDVPNQSFFSSQSQSPASLLYQHPIQTKMLLGQTNDKYEQEADQIAGNIVEQMHAPAVSDSHQQSLSQSEDTLYESVDTQPEVSRLQRQTVSPVDANNGVPGDVEEAIEQVRGQGHALPTSIKQATQQHLGGNPERLTVHTDTTADSLSRALGAAAFTTGSDIFFRQGYYNPASREGQELLLHETVHGYQQDNQSIQRKPTPSGRVIQRAPVKETVPRFGSHFEDTSIGIESELTGFVCALAQRDSQVFAYVKSSEGEPLVMVSKDMSQGKYANPTNRGDIKAQDNWRAHTVELITYPSLKKDEMAIQNRKDAMLFLTDLFAKRITENNHQPLETTTSEDGKFQLVISNPKHIIAAGNGMQINGGGSVGMGLSGQQATIGVKAKDFGTGASPDLMMLEKAPWYQAALKNDDELMTRLSQQETTTDIGTIQNVYAYLTSVMSFAMKLCEKWGIFIDEWDPLERNITPAAQGLTDPKVKNEWQILPRTTPSKMFGLLGQGDRRVVKQAIKNRLLNMTDDKILATAISNYFFGDGQVAGHGIDKATIGDPDNPDMAILFEFRSISEDLKPYVPVKEEGVAKVEALSLDQFKGETRKLIVADIVEAVNSAGSEFDTWYQEYREQAGKPRVKNPKRTASINEKAKWLQTIKPVEWQKIIQNR